MCAFLQPYSLGAVCETQQENSSESWYRYVCLCVCMILYVHRALHIFLHTLRNIMRTYYILIYIIYIYLLIYIYIYLYLFIFFIYLFVYLFTYLYIYIYISIYILCKMQRSQNTCRWVGSNMGYSSPVRRQRRPWSFTQSSRVILLALNEWTDRRAHYSIHKLKNASQIVRY